MEENDCLFTIQSTLMSTPGAKNVEKRQVTPFKSSQCGECCSLRWCSGLFVGTWCPCTGGAVGHVGTSSETSPANLYTSKLVQSLRLIKFSHCVEKGLRLDLQKKTKNHQQLDIGRLAGYMGAPHEFNCQGKGHARGPVCW